MMATDGPKVEAAMTVVLTLAIDLALANLLWHTLTLALPLSTSPFCGRGDSLILIILLCPLWLLPTALP